MILPSEKLTQPNCSEAAVGMSMDGEQAMKWKQTLSGFFGAIVSCCRISIRLHDINII